MAGCRKRPRTIPRGWMPSAVSSSIPSTAPAPSSTARRAFAHSLAVVDGGEVTAGVVYLPMKDKLYAAARGHGATLNSVGISVSAKTSATDATALATKPNVQPKHWKGGVPPFQRVYRPSIAYRLALVAEGHFDAMFTVPRHVGMGHRRGRRPGAGGRRHGDRRRGPVRLVQCGTPDVRRDHRRAGRTARVAVGLQVGALRHGAGEVTGHARNRGRAGRARRQAGHGRDQQQGTKGQQAYAKGHRPFISFHGGGVRHGFHDLVLASLR